MKTMLLIALVALVASGCHAAPAAPAAQSTDKAMIDGLQVSLAEVASTWNEAENQWHLVVAVTFANAGPGVFQLDKATACEGGSITNDVFDIEVSGRPVDYLGMMRKRAHPGEDGFFKIAAGDSMTIEVDLGGDYKLPANGGKAQVRFDHYNHFSVNDVQLTSPPIEVTLAR